MPNEATPQAPAPQDAQPKKPARAQSQPERNAQNTPIPGGGRWVWDDATRQWMPAPQYA